MHVTWTESKTTPGLFDYSAAGLTGSSRTPFLAAARAVLAADLAPPSEKLTGGRHKDECALSSTVGRAAKMTVTESKRGGAPKFAEYNEWWAAE